MAARLDTGSANYLGACALVEELVRLGVTQFVLSPGARSTALCVAAARHPGVQRLVHYDERGAAYYALGLGRATGQPAALVCTSGTAAANYLPAVIEAAQDGVPLLLLTADRPPELRQTGANQAIDQVKLFGSYVRGQADLPCPDDGAPLASLLGAAAEASAQARGCPPGPVHLNCMYREPFLPVEAVPPPGEFLARHEPLLPPGWLASARPFNPLLPAAPGLEAAGGAALAALVAGSRAGLILAGALAHDAERQALREVAARLQWPVVADLRSGLRLGEFPERIDHAELLLGAPPQPPPDAILHLGGNFVSARVQQFLAQHAGLPRLHLRPDPRRLDPRQLGGLRLQATLPELARVAAAWPPGPPSALLAPWRAASARLAAVLAARLDQESPGTPLREAAIARAVAALTPPGHGLFAAASLPVRELDSFAPGAAACPPLAANRGASGIDGTVASAAGFAAGLGRPVTLLCGDLALLHDLNSLILARQGPQPLTIVLLNNDGGGIFHFLPVRAQTEVFETCFATPHGLDFAAAAAQFGLEYQRPAGLAEFRAAYARAMAAPAPRLFELRTGRAGNPGLHQELLAAAAAAWEAPA